jgi:hypothetical protein
MPVSRLLAVAVLLLMLAAPASAQGAKRSAGSQKPVLRKAVTPPNAPALIDAAAKLGQRYWGAVPCNGQVKFVAQRPVPAGLHSDSDAWVTFGTPLGANNLAAPASSYTSCTVGLAKWRWPTSASMREDWDMLCTTMVHEMGHLLGRVHDDAPGNVMASVFTDTSAVPAICRANRPARSAR